MTRLALLLAGLAAGFVVLSAGPAVAQPPVVEAGECLYLVGAPPGAPAAETEERTQSSRIHDVCTMEAHVDLNRDGENMIQPWLLPDLAYPPHFRSCAASALVGHRFQVPADLAPGTRAWVSLDAAARGQLDAMGGFEWSDSNCLEVTMRIREHPSVSGPRLVAEGPLLKECVGITETRVLDEDLGRTLSFLPLPGRTYSVELVVRLDGKSFLGGLDAGSPGSGHHISYDRIGVCLEPPASATGSGDRSLEHALYLRDCYPGVWLPSALGGRLEEARALIATRLLQAQASEAPGVNSAAAQRSLDQADDAAADGDYQRACRSLVQGLHALTTP